MKKYAKSKMFKKIALILLVIIIFNFMVVNVSRADSDEGGVLFNPITDFLKTISDLILGFIQNIFVGDKDLIKTTSENTDYLDIVKNSTSFLDLESRLKSARMC